MTNSGAALRSERAGNKQAVAEAGASGRQRERPGDGDLPFFRKDVSGGRERRLMPVMELIVDDACDVGERKWTGKDVDGERRADWIGGPLVQSKGSRCFLRFYNSAYIISR